MRERILEILRNHNRRFVSGEKLSRELGCSRMAVWKHMDELRNQGYRIESQRRKGYRLLQEPDAIDAEKLKARLNTNWMGLKIEYHAVLESTQIRAHQLAKEGAPSGTLVLAEKQTGGKGRLGRRWHSPPGSGIWLSLILRPEIPLAHASQVTLLTAVAVARTLSSLGYDVSIKWPNDLLIDGKKVCGILTELQGDLDRVAYMVVGVGINVHMRLEDFPEALSDKATSLYLANPGRVPARREVLQRFCEEFERLFELYRTRGFAPIKTLWESYAVSLSRPIVVHTLNQTFSGYARGITEQGVLLVEDPSGKIHEVHSADIEVDRY